MSYKVYEIAKLSGVTIKTLYHYQKIGLLIPESIAENGYRYYGDEELNRLQQILFYRELDFPLESIKTALDGKLDRLRCLYDQRALLRVKEQRLHSILSTLEEAIQHEKKGVPMKEEKMFTGLNKKEWEDALVVQNQHLQEKYSYVIDTKAIDADAINEKAHEAADFISFMAISLKNGISASDKRVSDAIERHIEFMQLDMNTDALEFIAQTKFFIMDDFHRKILEAQQTGLGYYIYFAAESYASK